MALEPVTVMNLVLALIIFILGIWVYRVKNIVLAVYVAIGFGLFAISHFLVLLGTNSSDISIIIIRALGYLIVIYALIKEAMKKIT
jgi:hypothetical protein